jgi:hypothetical protein
MKDELKIQLCKLTSLSGNPQDHSWFGILLEGLKTHHTVLLSILIYYDKRKQRNISLFKDQGKPDTCFQSSSPKSNTGGPNSPETSCDTGTKHFQPKMLLRDSVYKVLMVYPVSVWQAHSESKQVLSTNHLFRLRQT